MLKNQPSINANSPAIYKMTRAGRIDFYFDSTDLPEHQQEFEDMRENGWVLEGEVEALPSYLPLRRRALENAGLEKLKFSWGYKKK